MTIVNAEIKPGENQPAKNLRRGREGNSAKFKHASQETGASPGGGRVEARNRTGASPGDSHINFNFNKGAKLLPNKKKISSKLKPSKLNVIDLVAKLIKMFYIL